MSVTRRKNGHVVTAAPPSAKEHGRLVAMAPAVRQRIEPGDAASRYAVACVERTVARLRGDSRDYANAKRRAERARAELVRLDGGNEEVRRINVALGNAGPALRSAVRAAVPVREYAVAMVVAFMSIVREHDVQTSAGLSRVFSAAAWGELENMLRDYAIEIGPSKKVFGDLVKLGASCEASARHALGWALHLEEKARVAQREAEATRMRAQWTRPAVLPAEPVDALEDASGVADERVEPPEASGVAGADSGAATGIGEDEEREADEAPPPRQAIDTRVSIPRADGDPGQARRDYFASIGPRPNSTRWDPAKGCMVPATAGPPAAPRTPSAAPKKLSAEELARVPAPPPPGAVLRFDHARGLIPVAGAAKARPTPEGLALMREKGIDTSRWENSE